MSAGFLDSKISTCLYSNYLKCVCGYLGLVPNLLPTIASIATNINFWNNED